MNLRRRGPLLVRTCLILVALGLLEIAPRAGWSDVLTLVPLSEMLTTLMHLFTTGEIYPHLVTTSVGVGCSFLLAALTGIPFGLLLARVRLLHTLLNPYLTGYYAVPVFVFYPLLVALFGMSAIPTVLIAWAWSVVAVVVNTAYGFRQVRPVFLKVAALYGLSGWRRFWRVEFPAASPYVFAGLKLAVTYSVIGVVASEFVLATKGLGWLVSFNYNNFGVEEMYATILLVLLLAALINLLVGRIQVHFAGRT